MQRVYLTMNEQEKYEVIKQLSDGAINKRRAEIRLGLSRRQIDRLLKKYKEKGKAAFIHGNSSKKPVNKMEPSLIESILQLAKGKYKGEKENYLLCNFKHFKTLLLRDENISISYTSLRSILISNKIRSPRIQRKTRRRLKKEEYLELIKKSAFDEQKIDEIVNRELAFEDAHPTKERCKYFGEQIQMDACSQNWGSFFAHLHLAIDNATGVPVGAFLDKQETLFGYYNVFKQILLTYGIPNSFLTDKRTIFTYKDSQRKDESENTLIQFAYACKILGVMLDVTSIAEKKGQVERYNGIFQDRLKAELIIYGITTIEKANEYINNVFIPNYIKEFNLSTKSCDSVFQSVDNEKINYYLSRVCRRKIDKGNCIRFQNKTYGTYNSDGVRILYQNKTDCLVIQTFNGELFANVEDKTYSLVEIELNSSYSSNFDPDSEKPKRKKYNIPSMDHPWRHANYDKFVEANERRYFY